MSAPAPPSAAVEIYNPLPAALANYEDALAEVLSAAGLPNVARGSAPSVEMGDGDRRARLLQAARVVRSQGRLVRRPRLIIACWPSFGLLEPLLWRRVGARARVTIVVHDPEPLRRQYGMGAVSARLGAAAISEGRVEAVVHSLPARDALVAAGWPSVPVVPIPISPRGPSGASSRQGLRRVSVCGQWKPARHLELLRAIGPPLARRGWAPVVAGRGWPPIEGWAVRDEFLSEGDLDEEIMSSACVVIPYTRFFQSGIAVRAVELGCGVVGPRHPFLEDLLGPSWPGLVDSDEPGHWVDAVEAVAALGLDVLVALHGTYARRCVDAWREFTARLAGGPGRHRGVAGSRAAR